MQISKAIDQDVNNLLQILDTNRPITKYISNLSEADKG